MWYNWHCAGSSKRSWTVNHRSWSLQAGVTVNHPDWIVAPCQSPWHSPTTWHRWPRTSCQISRLQQRLPAPLEWLSANIPKVHPMQLGHDCAANHVLPKSHSMQQGGMEGTLDPSPFHHKKGRNGTVETLRKHTDQPHLESDARKPYRLAPQLVRASMHAGANTGGCINGRVQI